MPREDLLPIDRTDAIFASDAEIFFSEAEREMGAFVAAAEELYGVEAGHLAAEFWIEQVNKLDPSNRQRSTLRQVTGAAASKLAKNTVEDPSNPPERIAITSVSNTRPSVGVASNEALLDDARRPFVVSRNPASKHRVEGQLPGIRSGNRSALEIHESPIRTFGELQQPFDDPSEPDPVGILGCMTNDISHDIRNHLCAVYAHAELMSQSTRSQTEREEHLEDVHSAICSSIALLDSLLLPARTDHTHNFRRHPLNQIIAHTARMVRIHPDARNVTFSIDDYPAVEAWVDSRELGRAVYNLLLNACQATSNGSAPRLVQVALQEERASIQIRVMDNGSGVPESIREMFRMGFSTVESTKRIGLGLAIAQCAAREHGGSLELEESMSGKTVFVLHLPKLTPTPLSAALAGDMSDLPRFSQPVIAGVSRF